MACRLAKRAEADLEDIAYYIAKESGSLETAKRVIESITDRFHLLGANPYAGRARDDDLGPGRRSFSGRPIYHRLPRLRPGRAYPARGTQPPGHRGAIRPLSGARGGPQGPPHSRSALTTIIFGLLKYYVIKLSWCRARYSSFLKRHGVAAKRVHLFPVGSSYVSQNTKRD